MKIKFKHEQTWDGHHFQVQLDGKKFPKEKGAWYHPFSNDELKAKAEAKVWALAEHSGKYLARDGKIYNSKQDYEDYYNTLI
jgi:hypothetical protein